VIAFSSPLWLAGLGLLPVLWWLHRRASRGRTLVVPSVLLFRQAQAAAGDAHGVRRLDASFWRRAALIACFSVALAGPGIQGRGSKVAVWIDDSLSMRSQEPGGSRMELGCRILAQSLTARGAVTATIESLSEPGAARRVTPPFSRESVCGDRPIGAPQLPLVRLMGRGVEHWLLTDGANPVVNAWATQAPLSRIVQIGKATENAALTRLAARASLADSTRLDLDVEAANLGTRVARRTLTVTRGTTQVSSAPLSLNPGAQVALRLTLPVDGPGALTARLDPGDALADDDLLTLDLSQAAALAVRIDPACAAPVRAALLANPGIAAAKAGGTSDITVTCSADLAPADPGFALRRGGQSRALDSRPRWLDLDLIDQMRVQIPLDRLHLRVWDHPLAAHPRDEVVLAAGDTPLAIRRAGFTHTLETNLDLEDRELAADPSYPLLISALLERATGRELAGGRVDARRLAASRIAPVTTLAAHAGAITAPARLDLTPYLLAVALLLLALELIFAALTLTRDWRFYRQPS